MAVAIEAPSPSLSKDAIVQLALDRQRQYASRDAWYDTLMTYYFGKPEEHPASTYVPPVLAMNSQGRPLLRPFEVGAAMDAKRGYTSKRLAPIVDDYMALKGVMPSTRVIPPHGAEGEEKADLLTKYLLSTQELSDMGRQQPEAGFWQSMLGDALYQLEPANVEGSKWRVVWEVCSPRIAYPTFYRGYRKHQIYDLITIQQWDAYDINQTFKDYGIRVPIESPPDDRTVITYVSPHQRTMVVGTRNPQVGPNAEWDLGFCPAMWAYNKTPGHMGMADIQHALTQQDFLDFLLSVMADGFVNSTYPLVGIRNSQEVGEDQLLRGPDAAPIHLEGPDSDIIVRSTSGDVRAAMQMVDQTVQDITAGTGSSSTRQTGEMKSSIQTGRALHATQGPQSTRIDLWHQTMTQVMQSLNSMTLQMQERAPYLRSFDADVFGNYRGNSFQVRFNAKKDIDGWHRNTVRFEQMVGLNQQQKISIAYEGLAAKLWDKPYARELVGVDDPLGMDDRIEQDAIREARTQADIQKIMQGGEGGQSQPGGGTPPPGGATGGLPAHGGHNAGPSPQAIFRPPGLKSGPGSGNAGAPPSQGAGAPTGQRGAPAQSKMGVSRDTLRAIILGIADTLKGEVYALGDLAFGGNANQVQLAITDSRDYSKVLGAVKPLAPQAKVVQMKSANIPPEAVRLL